MKNPIAKLCAAAIMVALAAVPAEAASFQFGGAQNAQVQNAQFSFSFGTGDRDRDRGRFERRGSNYFFNGYRGYRDHRPGYRRYNGYWFPDSAFSFNFSIGGNRSGMRVSSRHVVWCEDRYRSYRASDNSFQPYNGPRQECVSPYSR